MSADAINTDDNRIALTPVLDLCAAVPLAQDFTAHRGKDIEVDASKVERAGAQCLQVLLSAVKTWSADGHSLEITNESPAFADAVSDLGVQLSVNATSEREECR